MLKPSATEYDKSKSINLLILIIYLLIATLLTFSTEAEKGHRKKRKEIAKKESRSRKKKRNREKRKEIEKKECKSERKKANRKKRKQIAKKERKY